MRTRILRGPGRWAAVGPVWTALAAEVPIRSHLQLPHWAHALTDVLHDGSARWFLAEDDDGPLAAVPYHLRLRRIGPVRVRVLATDRVSDGLLAPRARPADLRQALLAASAAAGEPLGVLSYNGLRPGSGLLRLATSAPSGLAAETNHGGYSVVETGVSGDAWFAAAGRNLRGSLRKARNRFERLGTMSVTTATGRSEVEAGIDDFVAVEATGWKGTSGALANRPSDLAMLRRFLLAECDRGTAVVRTLRLDDRPVAGQLASITAGTLELYKVAYDDELSHLSPSNLLMADLVRECCDRADVERIDLLTSQPWHGRWYASHHPTYQAYDADLRRPGGVAGGLGRALRRPRHRLPPA